MLAFTLRIFCTLRLCFLLLFATQAGSVLAQSLTVEPAQSFPGTRVIVSGLGWPRCNATSSPISCEISLVWDPAQTSTPVADPSATLKPPFTTPANTGP